MKRVEKHTRNVKSDVIFKEFWRNNERFADLFNAVVFGGREVIKPEILQEIDVDVSGVIQMKDYKETLTRIRDVVKKTAYGTEFVVLGVESQQHIHYAMPLRHMIYDAMSYLKEYQELTRKCGKDDGKKTTDEFLSRMKKNERLHPVITLTIYYGEKEWDGPHCLRDMIVEMSEEIDSIFSDYKMNLLEVRDSGKYIFNNTDVQSVFEITRETFAGHFDAIREKYGDKELGAELLTMIGQMTGSKKIVSMGKNKEADNMCTALEQLIEDGKKLGMQEGMIDGILTSVKNLMESMGWTAEQAMDALKISQEDRNKYAGMLKKQ